MRQIPESELIVNPDGSVYHLHLRPEQIADTIIVVGDSGRVPTISRHFDRTEYICQNREFLTHTGYIGNKRLSVLSTGIGIGNIDIVVNELDALVNIDLEKRTMKPELKSLNIIRLGTSGALQEDIPVDSFVAATHGLGLDGLIYFYADAKKVIDEHITGAFIRHAAWMLDLPAPYLVKGDERLLNVIRKGAFQGITATSFGFYGPQGRMLRLVPAVEDLLESLESFRYEDLRVMNFEMETSALFGMGRMLGHQTASICAIIANRLRKEFSADYQATVEKLIVHLLTNLTESA